jgi:hypothetical protein
MARRPPARGLLAAVAVLAAPALLGCRPATVSVTYAPHVGDRYGYRYEITATVTREVEGERPEVTRVDTELLADQVVQARTQGGARIRLRLTREGGAPRTAVAIVDRAGSLEGLELVAGLGDAVLGVADDGVLVPNLPGPPDRPLAPGARWSIAAGRRTGEGRLERLGVIDGVEVAVVRTSATEELVRDVTAGASPTELRGAVRSGATTSYDLAGGAVRRSRSWSRGEVRAELQPPEGIDARPVVATISYEVTVVVTRTR